MLAAMPKEKESHPSLKPSETEMEIKSLIESLSAERERERSIKECRLAASKPSEDKAA